MPAIDGAHASAMPTVPCPQVTTGQPPLGALPLGTATVPETPVFSPLVDVDP